MKAKYTFSSPTLQKIDSEAETVISSHLQSLDRVSNDIKSLEEKLKTAAIPFTFIYILSTRNTVSQEDGWEDRDIWEEPCLVWGKSETNDFRLLYNLYKTEDISVQGSTYEGTPKLELSKPLIESKAHLRLQIENELPFFYELIIKSIKTESKKGRIIVSSPSNDFMSGFSRIMERGIGE